MKKLLLTLLLGIVAVGATAQTKYAGGDISLLPSYEDHGAIYYDYGGNQITDMLAFFKAQGLNALRVRLFVDPSQAPTDEIGQGVVQDIDYVKSLGKRIKDAGFAFMLDFHYSDSWADPAKQYTPAAWVGLADSELYTKIYDYTKESLQALNDAGATPDMIQIGNEISYGMLWGARATGNTKYYATSGTNAGRFYSLLKNASKACREVCPSAKIIIHTERVGQTSYLSSFYKNMEAQSIDYDIIGLSYYPYYHGKLPQLESALKLMQAEHADKRIMIVETGYYHAWQPSSVTYDYSATFAIGDDGQKAFTDSLITTLKKYDHVDGLFWWMMEANEYGLDWNTKRVTDSWYNCSLFDNSTGKVLGGLSSLKNFIGSSASVDGINADGDAAPYRWYTLAGQRVDAPAHRGVYVRGDKKVVVK